VFFQQAERFPHNLTGGVVAAGLHLSLDKLLKLGGKRYIHKTPLDLFYQEPGLPGIERTGVTTQSSPMESSLRSHVHLIRRFVATKPDTTLKSS
jgi:hypothetical protein